MRLFNIFYEEILAFSINSWIFSSKKLIEKLFEFQKNEKNENLQRILEKILRKIMLKFPNFLNFQALFRNLFNFSIFSQEDGILMKNSLNFPLKLLREICEISLQRAFPMKSLIFLHEKSAISIDFLEGLKNSEVFSLYFEAKFLINSSKNSWNFLTFCSKSRKTRFAIKFKRISSTKVFSLFFTINSTNFKQEIIEFSSLFEENQWFSLRISYEKAAISVIFDEKQLEIKKILQKNWLKDFEKHFSLIIGFNEENEINSNGFQGELRTFFFTNKLVKSKEELEHCYENRDFLVNIEEIAGVCKGFSPELNELWVVNDENAVFTCVFDRRKEKFDFYNDKKCEFFEKSGFYEKLAEKTQEKNEEKKAGVFTKKKNSIKKNSKKTSFKQKSVFLLETGCFIDVFLSFEAIEKLVFLIEFYSFEDKYQQLLCEILEILRNLFFYEEIQQFFKEKSLNFLMIPLKIFVKKLGFSKEILQKLFNLYDFLKKTSLFFKKDQLFFAFFLDFDIFSTSSLEIQLFFFDKFANELQIEQESFKETLFQDIFFIKKLFFTIEIHYNSIENSLENSLENSTIKNSSRKTSKEISAKFYEKRTFRDYLLNFLRFSLKTENPTKNFPIFEDFLRETKTFHLEYLDLCKDFFKEKGGFTAENYENFESSILELLLKKPDCEEFLEVFFDVFVKNRRKLIFSEGTLPKLLEIAKKDLKKFEFINEILPENLSEKILYKMLDFLKEALFLGLSFEEVLFRCLLNRTFQHKNTVFRKEVLKKLKKLFEEFPNLIEFFFDKGNGVFLAKTLDFPWQDSNEKFEILKFLIEIFDFSFENLENFTEEIENFLLYDNFLHLKSFLNIFVEILLKNSKSKLFINNSSEIIRILLKILRKKPEKNLSKIPELWILLWKFLSFIEFSSKKTLFYEDFSKLIFEILDEISENQEDFLQGLQILKKSILECEEIINKGFFYEKILFFLILLMKKPQNQSFYEKNEVIWMALMRILYEVLGFFEIKQLFKLFQADFLPEINENEVLEFQKVLDFREIYAKFEENSQILTFQEFEFEEKFQENFKEKLKKKFNDEKYDKFKEENFNEKFEELTMEFELEFGIFRGNLRIGIIFKEFYAKNSMGQELLDVGFRVLYNKFYREYELVFLLYSL